MKCDARMPLTSLFFNELKQYNSSNFKTLCTACLSVANPAVIKAFSSVITRYFIFCEKHPEISVIDKRVLYFQLKVDMVARFFANYPDMDIADLVAFQTELHYYQKQNDGDDLDGNTAEI